MSLYLNSFLDTSTPSANASASPSVNNSSMLPLVMEAHASQAREAALPAACTPILKPLILQLIGVAAYSAQVGVAHSRSLGPFTIDYQVRAGTGVWSNVYTREFEVLCCCATLIVTRDREN